MQHGENGYITKKIFDVLKFVTAQQYDVGVSEIARAGGLSKGTTFGILVGLEKAGYISKRRATAKYTIGPELFQLSELIERRTNLPVIAKPFMERLSRKVNRTVFLGVKEDDKIRIDVVIEAKGLLTVSSSIGTRLPLSSGAHARALLSAMQDEEIAEGIGGQLFSGLKNKRGEEVDIWSEIEEVRRMGYALDLNEEYMAGIWAAAMALGCGCGSRPAVLWVAGFKAGLNDTKLNKIINGLRQTVGDINAAAKARFDERIQNVDSSRSAMVSDRGFSRTMSGSEG